jgi:superoxide reductase
MTQLKQLYKCSVCGNTVEVVHGAGGQMVCCGKPMELLVENSVEASTEKHVPVIERLDGEVIVKVGSVEHPMLAEHYIEWIELITEKRVYRKHLAPGEEPKASFKICDSVKNFTVREYCNIHGLWKAEY